MTTLFWLTAAAFGAAIAALWIGWRTYCSYQLVNWLGGLPHHNPMLYHSHRSRLSGHRESWVYPPYGDDTI